MTPTDTNHGDGTLLLQTSGVIDATSRALPTVPPGANYAQLQFHGAGISARYDGAAATGSAVEEQYAAGGSLIINTAADLANFRYLGTGTGTFSVIYRSA